MISLLLPGITRGQDTLVCDNGGFENDIVYYSGFISHFKAGSCSSTCDPKINGTPVVFTSANMQQANRFQISAVGTDPLTNEPRVKFGEYSFLLNSHCSSQGDCNHAGDINRLRKRFKVTEATRNFTIWYSAVLENPTTGHNDNQPFFSIKCDLASSGNLCFDGSNFPADRIDRGLLACNPYDSLCYEENDFVKYTRWTCHRFHIPKSEIGNIATLSITAADCGRDPQGGGHFGYVYIDGICESCGGGSYGSASISEASYDLIVSCQGDSISIKGNYTLPTINGGFTIFDDFTVPGFNIYGKSINTTNKTFSFRIVKSDFQSPNPSCRDVIAYLKFKNANNDFLPDVPTNAIEICLDDFVVPDVDITISGCHRNNPNDNNYSDDYYYVDFTIQDADIAYWTLERQLDDPPTGESGRYFLKQNGYGNGLHILGPFLIQEGAWTLILNYNHCADTFYITPPDYCSGCNQLAQTKITNITCVSGNTWTYDLRVDGTPPQGSTYRILGEVTDRYFGVQYTNLPGGAITQNCIDLTLTYHLNGPQCPAIFKICPPKPCTDNPNCNFEAYFEKLNCLNNGTFTINFITKGGGFPCYKAVGATTNVSGSFANPLGPFNEDVTITLLACSTPFDCTCTNTNCYKMYFIDKPEDCPRDLEGRLNRSNAEILDNDLIVVPNPVSADEFLLRSKMKTTEYEIYNSSGMIINSNKFEGDEFKIRFNHSQGVYYLKYKDSSGLIRSVKFIKL